ncbi:protein BTG2-like [Liolophura sinensis]|uniref:protein BTG2-like n=1 Tax=Liolophura sinensis TaxID=3198878 RepID=UPI00315940EF
MKEELKSACDFLCTLMKGKGVSQEMADFFSAKLQSMLCTKYVDHWFPDRPFKGSGFRCIRINHKLDPIVRSAGESCGWTESQLRSLLPHELTVWVDPKEVSYRFGENGSICVVHTESSHSSSKPSQMISESEIPYPQLTCKDLRRVLPREGMNLQQLAAFVYS